MRGVRIQGPVHYGQRLISASLALAACEAFLDPIDHGVPSFLNRVVGFGRRAVTEG